MKMLSWSANMMRDVVKFVNENGLKKEDIVAVLRENDCTYTVVYYAEE